MTIKCKYYDTIGDCTPHPVCKNPWIKGKADLPGYAVPHCPFKDTGDARVYCAKYESSVKYYVTNGETKISGLFDSRGLAQRFINSLRIEEYE